VVISPNIDVHEYLNLEISSRVITEGVPASKLEIGVPQAVE
jgi:hypothetical protein